MENFRFTSLNMSITHLKKSYSGEIGTRACSAHTGAMRNS